MEAGDCTRFYRQASCDVLVSVCVKALPYWYPKQRVGVNVFSGKRHHPLRKQSIAFPKRQATFHFGASVKEALSELTTRTAASSPKVGPVINGQGTT